MGQSLIRRDFHVSLYLWACTGSVQNYRKVLRIYFSSSPCGVSQDLDKEQIWMGKQLIVVLLKLMTQEAHSGLLPLIFCPLSVTWETLSQSAKDNLGNFLGNSI